MPPPLPVKLPRYLRVLYGAGLTIIALLFVMGVGMLTIVQSFSLPTGSMEPTLLLGDHLLSLRQGLMGPIVRSDLVVFRYPVDQQQTFVKRVVGLPGDRIRIVNKTLRLNGAKIEEPYAEHRTDYIDSYRDNFPTEPNVAVFDAARTMLETDVHDGDVVVPPGRYFVLGDNRDMSLDSRYWGFVPADLVLGRPILVTSSSDKGVWRWNRALLPLRRIH